MISLNKQEILQKIAEEGTVSKADNSGGKMEENEFRKLLVTGKCTEDIEIAINKLSDQIQKSTDSNSKLSNRILWLNIVVAVATVVIAVCSIIGIYYKN